MDRSSPNLESLTETGRKYFEILREWRQRTAEKEGVPAYVIAKNSQFNACSRTVPVRAKRVVNSIAPRRRISVVGSFFTFVIAFLQRVISNLYK
ncbi:MAG TPA: hypothetical protein GXZ47_02030 [Treponema sp.]|nr:hypothetical protein [Treponema sp.]